MILVRNFTIVRGSESAGCTFRDTLRIPPCTLDSGLRRYSILLRLQVQGRHPWRACSAARASPLPLTVPVRTIHTHLTAAEYPGVIEKSP
jgi:hypothetical protein